MKINGHRLRPRAKLSGANISSLSGLSRAKLRDADLSNATIHGSHFNDVDFSGANLSGASIVRCDVGRSIFTGANLQNAKLGCSVYSGTPFSGADLRGADLSCADLRQVSFAGAILGGTKFAAACLLRTNFSGAYGIEDCTFTHTTASRKIELDDGTPYEISPTTYRAQYTDSTHWPSGFDPERAGLTLISEQNFIFDSHMYGVHGREIWLED